MNILFGLVRPDSGHIEINGKKASIKSPNDALNLGIGMVHQHFSLVPTLNVLENFKLITLAKNIDTEEILNLSKRLNLNLDLTAKVSSLSAGERQRLEVLRLLYFNFNILIFDEPTSVLTPIETENLLKEISKMATEGKAIFFISHKLNEVKAVSDRITVLRKGKVTWNGDARGVSIDELVKYMIEKLPKVESKLDIQNREEVLSISNLKVKGSRGHLAVNFKSKIHIYKNEIVAIAGVAGNGQRELFDAIMGLRKIEEGKIIFKGKDITHSSTSKRIELGIGYIPEDRILTGLAPDLSIKENLALKLYDKQQYHKWHLIDDSKIKAMADALLREYDIRAANVDLPVKNLSGGNLQKVILAREISMNPDLLLAYEPTKGLDIGASYFIRNKLIDFASKGGSVLLFSEDLEELLFLSDRLFVIYNGEITAEFSRAQFDEYSIGKAMSVVSFVEVSD
jgi:simple sugar transport system ATP-binding protein